jgi:hypothetical protein
MPQTFNIVTHIIKIDIVEALNIFYKIESTIEMFSSFRLFGKFYVFTFNNSKIVALKLIT